MKLLFVLDMPNNNAWNGRWSGGGKFYGRIRTFRKTKAAEAKLGALVGKGYFYYSFGDGWGASVTLSWATDADVRRVHKESRGFCGYDWMIDSILEWGEILSTTQERERRLVKTSSLEGAA